LQRNDVAKVISENEKFDFLLDVIPREEIPSEQHLTEMQTSLLGDIDRMKRNKNEYQQMS
jgi:hypothetical protein